MGKNDSNTNDEEEPLGDKLVAPPDFYGPTRDRKCTDILCSVLIVAMWVAMTLVGIYSLQRGDFRVILFPLDYDGNICGTDYSGKDMTDFPFLYYINNYGGGVCVDKCPNLEGAVADNLTDIQTMITYAGLWQNGDGAELAADYIKIGDYSDSNDAIACSANACYPGTAEESWDSQGVNKGFGYAFYAADSYNLLQRCYINFDASDRIQELTSSNSTLASLEAGYDFWNDIYADVWNSKAIILGFGFGAALGLSFMYIYLLRLPLLINGVIWGSIFIAVAFFFATGIYAFLQAKWWEEEVPQVWSDTSIKATRYSAYGLWGIGALMALVMFCLRKHIQLAISCVKETGRAITRMPFIILVPVVQGLGFIAFLCTFVVYGVYLASIGEVTSRDIPVSTEGVEIAIREFDFNETILNMAWYLLFCFFWTSNFIVAVGDMIVSMSVAKWYFTREKKKINSSTVLASFKDVVWYHLGTCAYGSLILGLVQFARTALARLQKQVKKSGSKIASALLCCCQCCLWCFEKCIRFINKNAYIQTAIFGTNFCQSAREAFFLILRNAGRIAAVSYVSGAVLIIGKLFISGATTCASYFLMIELAGEDVYSVAGPMVLIFLISYFVADFFLDVFEMALTTILQCFVADEEMFSGEEAYADGALRKWIDRN